MTEAKCHFAKGAQMQGNTSPTMLFLLLCAALALTLNLEVSWRPSRSSGLLPGMASVRLAADHRVIWTDPQSVKSHLAHLVVHCGGRQ